MWWVEVIAPHPHSYVATLTPNGTVFGDGTFKEMLKVEVGEKGGP